MNQEIDVRRTAVGRAEHHDAAEVRRRAIAKGVADKDAAKRVRDEVDAGRGFHDGRERGKEVCGDFVRRAVGGIGADETVLYPASRIAAAILPMLRPVRRIPWIRTTVSRVASGAPSTSGSARQEAQPIAMAMATSSAKTNRRIWRDRFTASLIQEPEQPYRDSESKIHPKY